MANRCVYPSSLFPLRGDLSAEAGATSVLVTGIQGIPVISPPTEPDGLDTFFYDSYNNEWFYASPWEIPVGRVLEFEGYGYNPAGISWLASDTIAIGDGTQGDVSGAAAMTALVLFGPATYDGPYGYDSEYGPPYDQFYTTIYSGATQDWILTLPSGPGAAGQVLETNGRGITSWVTVSSSTSPGGSSGDIQFNNGSGFGGSAATITSGGTITIPAGQSLIDSGTFTDSTGAVGILGQLLESTVTGTKWVTPAAIPSNTYSYFYSNGLSDPNRAYSVNQVISAATNGLVYLVQIYIAQTLTVNTIVSYCDTTESAYANFGLYNASTGNLVVDSGAIAAVGGGPVYSPSDSLKASITPGWYWFAYTLNSTAGCWLVFNNSSGTILNSTAGTGQASVAVRSGNLCSNVGTSSQALPSSVGTLGAFNTSVYFPIVLFTQQALT